MKKDGPASGPVAANVQGAIHVPTPLGSRKKKKIKKVAKTLYVNRPVLNADEIIAWAKENGIEKCVQPDDMHVTLAFSRAAVDWPKPDKSPLHIFPKDTTLTLFGPDKDCLVLTFDSALLKERWQELCDAGCSWDWKGFRPHITLSYSFELRTQQYIPSYKGPILLGSEEFAEVNEDWKDDVVEKAKKSKDSAFKKNDRSIFAYMTPPANAAPEVKAQFAQCRTCRMLVPEGAMPDEGKHKKGCDLCVVIGSQDAVDGGKDRGSCDEYVGWPTPDGTPAPDVIKEHAKKLATGVGGSATKEEVGYVERKVRCKNCYFGKNGATECDWYYQLSKELPELFDDTGPIEPGACCNSQTAPKMTKGENMAIKKIGARNNRSDAARIQQMHDHACALGANCGLDGDEADPVIVEHYDQGLTAHEDDVDKVARICKVDESLGLVFGYAIVCTKDGKDYYDLNIDKAEDGTVTRVPEHIPEASMLKAAVDFMQTARPGNEMHDGPDVGTFVFAFPMTKEIAKSFGIQTSMTGLMVAYKPTPAVFAKFKDGTYKGFSIEGRRITAKMLQEEEDDDMEKRTHKASAGSTGVSYGGGGGGGDDGGDDEGDDE